jgi:hypothetical protein
MLRQGANAMLIRLSDIMRKWCGTGEANVRRGGKMARAKQSSDPIGIVNAARIHVFVGGDLGAT